ncbi:MAG: MoaD family protein [Candidatus Cloacimonetes bacterium]|jgi:molybdopterin synthase sulfur carrier subunit|nr:MoaD family protein [Candidatus Cloacimonadota bacterium]
MIKIKFYSLLRTFIEQNEIDIIADNISIYNVITKIEELTNKDLASELIEYHEIISGTIILVNGRNIFHLDKLNTVIKDGDNIDIFPPGGGG